MHGGFSLRQESHLRLVNADVLLSLNQIADRDAADADLLRAETLLETEVLVVDLRWPYITSHFGACRWPGLQHRP